MGDYTMRALLLRALATAAVALLAVSQSAAQTYPNRPVTLIVPYAAGGSSDVLARLIGERLSQLLGQQFVVENKAGAGSRIGTELAARAEPDGYTLILSDMPHTIVPALQANVGYHPVRDFAPIALIGTAPMFLFVHPTSPAQSAADFIARAKAEPGKITIASGGNGSTTHLMAELLQVRAGIKLAHIPYRGAGPAINDLVAGQVQSGFTTLATAGSLLEGGKIRALGVTAERRLPSHPAVPTFAESGLDLVVEHWWGILAPAKVPEPALQRLRQTVTTVLEAPDIRARFEQLGVVPASATPERFRALLESETTRWAEVVRTAGVKVE